jgi:hypothetical protein
MTGSSGWRSIAVAPGRQPEYSVTYESLRARSGPVHLTSLFDPLQPVATRGRPRSSPLCRHDPARPHRSLTCSNRAMGGGNLANDLPEWWAVPRAMRPGASLVTRPRLRLLHAMPVPRRRRHLRAHRGPVRDRLLPLSVVSPAALPAQRNVLRDTSVTGPGPTERPEVKGQAQDRRGAMWGAIVTRRGAIQGLLKRSITGINQSSSYSSRRQPTNQISFASRSSAPPPHAKVPFQDCWPLHLTHVADMPVIERHQDRGALRLDHRHDQALCRRRAVI